MLNILILINIILIIALIYILFFKPTKNNVLFSNFENIELIEFQRNLKDLIDELNKITNTGLKEWVNKKKEIDSNIVLIDAKIKELKYLLERNQIIRQSEYKKEISASIKNTIDEQNNSNIKENVIINPKIEKITDKNKNQIKILLDEKNNENTVNSNLKYSHVKNLIKNGVSIEEISKITGMSKGEIELIKNIRKQ